MFLFCCADKYRKTEQGKKADGNLVSNIGL